MTQEGNVLYDSHRSSRQASRTPSDAPSSRRSSGRESPAVPFGGGELPIEEIKRKRVKEYRREGPQWSMLVRHNTRLHEQTIARAKQLKRDQQRELGKAIRAQLKELEMKQRAEAAEKVESARRILHDVEKYREEEFRKVLETRARNERDRDFIQKQLKGRAEKALAAATRKRIMDQRTKEKLEKAAKKLAEDQEMARINRLREQRRARIENEIQRKEKIQRQIEEEREELRLQRLYAENVQKQEEQRKKALDERAAKVLALQRVNEGVQQNQKAKLEAEEERIRKYQEKVDRERGAELQARKDKHERGKQEMIRVVRSQLKVRQG